MFEETANSNIGDVVEDNMYTIILKTETASSAVGSHFYIRNPMFLLNFHINIGNYRELE